MVILKFVQFCCPVGDLLAFFFLCKKGNLCLKKKVEVKCG